MSDRGRLRHDAYSHIGLHHLAHRIEASNVDLSPHLLAVALHDLFDERVNGTVRAEADKVILHHVFDPHCIGRHQWMIHSADQNKSVSPVWARFQAISADVASNDANVGQAFMGSSRFQCNK